MFLFAGFNLINRKSENNNKDKEKNFHGSEEIVAGKKGSKRKGKDYHMAVKKFKYD